MLAMRLTSAQHRSYSRHREQSSVDRRLYYKGARGLENSFTLSFWKVRVIKVHTCTKYSPSLRFVRLFPEKLKAGIDHPVITDSNYGKASALNIPGANIFTMLLPSPN